MTVTTAHLACPDCRLVGHPGPAETLAPLVAVHDDLFHARRAVAVLVVERQPSARRSRRPRLRRVVGRYRSTAGRLLTAGGAGR